ncbi:MAG: MaoC family dehydratase [Polyangiales bacterium]
MPTVFHNLDELKAAVGKDLGATDWLTITQDRIDEFARATGDDQWIHVDPERAAKGPFGATIAHGYLTMSLSNYFLPQLVEVRGISMGVNYGVDKVRFPSPVKVNQRVRGRAQVASVEDVKGGVQAKIVITIEIDGESKPACVIESLSRYLA